MHRKDFVITAPIDQVAIQLETLIQDISKNGLRGQTGSYLGDGTSSKVVQIGFSPIFLVISRVVSLTSSFPVSGDMSFSLAATPGITYIPGTGFVKDGVTSYSNTGVSLGANSNVNSSGVSYTYLAIG